MPDKRKSNRKRERKTKTVASIPIPRPGEPEYDTASTAVQKLYDDQAARLLENPHLEAAHKSVDGFADWLRIEKRNRGFHIMLMHMVWGDQWEDRPQWEWQQALGFAIELANRLKIKPRMDRPERPIGLVKLHASYGRLLIDATAPAAAEKATTTKVPPALTGNAATVYEMLLELPPYRALTGSKILERLDDEQIHTDQSTLTTRIMPSLEPYGVENVPRIGYRIRPHRRPQ